MTTPAAELTLEVVAVQKPDDMNFIFGTSHFIKTVEDLYEALATSSPTIKFGLAVRTRPSLSAPRLCRTRRSRDA
jgi:adenosine/AMP kinase